MSLVEQELLTLPEHLSSHTVLSRVRSVASLLAAALYQGNPDRNHKLWNIVSSERYIFLALVILLIASIPSTLK
jgi:hypothetical protein